MYNVLIVGLGSISLLYDYEKPDVTWTHARALSEHNGFNIIAGIDPEKCNRDLFVNAYQHDAYSDLISFFEANEESIDLVVIATPTESHATTYNTLMANQYAKKCKLVLMEKPVASNVSELKLLMNRSGDVPVIMVNLFRLFQGHLNIYLERLSNSRIFDIQVNYSKGLLHNGIHFFTLLNKYFGECRSYTKIEGLNADAFQFSFRHCDAIFKSYTDEIDDNSMIIKSDIGSLYYLNGGRHSFFIDIYHNKFEFDVNDFNHYQKYVYQAVKAELDNARVVKHRDESFILACDAQEILSRCEGLI